MVSNKRIDTRGVTLVELLAVIVILGIITTIAVVGVRSLIQRQKINAAYASFDSCMEAAENYVIYEDLATNDTFTSADLVNAGYLSVDPFDAIVSFLVGENGAIKITSPSDPTIDGITPDAEFYALWLEVYASELIISEYVESIGANKAIEIFNGTGATVNLSGYTLRLYFDGATSYTYITLSGSISHQDVYVVLSPTLFTTLTVGDLSSSKLTFNGNDAVALVHDGVIIDAIGQIGYNPGTEWGTGLTSTLDNTIVRDATVIDSVSIGTDAFVPSVEWSGYAAATYDNLGSHLSNATEEPKP